MKSKNRQAFNDKKRRERILSEQPWMRSYWSAVSRCVRGRSYYKKGIKFLMTKDDFRILWFRDKAYLMDKPSIDRKDGSKHYTFDNCQYLELEENRRKRKVLVGYEFAQYSNDMKLVKVWKGIRATARTLGLNAKSMHNCITGRSKSAGGFIWKKI